MLVGYPFILPWPPTVNHYWCIGRASRGQSRICLGRAGKIYRKEVSKVLNPYWWVHTINRERLAIIIEVYPPDRRKRDLDNIIKPILDALVHARIVDDDSLFDSIKIVRKAPVQDGRLVITISKFSAPAA